MDHLSRSREQEEVQFSTMTRKITALEDQIVELTEQLQEETRLKIANINRCRQLEEEKNSTLDERDELENMKVQLQRDLQSSHNQLADARKKADEGIIMQLDEIKKKVAIFQLKNSSLENVFPYHNLSFMRNAMKTIVCSKA